MMIHECLLVPYALEIKLPANPVPDHVLGMGFDSMLANLTGRPVARAWMWGPGRGGSQAMLGCTRGRGLWGIADVNERALDFAAR